MRGGQAHATAARTTHHLAGLCTLLDVHDELLLLLLELCALAVELALRLGEGALVLAEPLRGGNGAPKECLLDSSNGVRLARKP